MTLIRKALPSDETALGVLGAALMRQHHESDARRFLMVDRPERGYGRFLVSQIEASEFHVLVADRDGEVVGYVLAGIEPTSWMDLRGPCGVIHDIYVHESARRQGIARELLRRAIEWVHSKGQAQVVLFTKTNNESAQRLFTSLGFRRTMTEMTLDEASDSQAGRSPMSQGDQAPGSIST